jgi:hypothetical protein
MNPHRTSIIVAALICTTLTACRAPQSKSQIAYFPDDPARARVVHLVSFNSLSEITPPKATFLDALRGPLGGPFIQTPAGIDYRDNHLYICDTGSNVLHDWNLESGSARIIGARGTATLAKPVDVAVDESGHIFVADTLRGEVLGYDPQGRNILKFQTVPPPLPPVDPLEELEDKLPPPPERDQQFQPAALAVDNKRLYIADIASHYVYIINPQTGETYETVGGAGDDKGKLYYPTGIDVASQSNSNGQADIYVSEMMNARVQRFSPTLAPILTMGQPGDRYGDMGKPRHIACAPDNILFVADPEFCRIHIFNTQGQLLLIIGGDEHPSAAFTPGATPMPVGICIANTLPLHLRSLVPHHFQPSYYLFSTNTVGEKRINLFAIGQSKPEM